MSNLSNSAFKAIKSSLAAKSDILMPAVCSNLFQLHNLLSLILL